MAQDIAHTDIIRKPIVTEKATAATDVANTYAFEVDRRATKTQIKDAVQALYKVRVVNVRTQNRKGEQRRFRHGFSDTASVRRAFVRVHADDKIELI